jgi:leucyl-tRNA synthetase
MYNFRNIQEKWENVFVKYSVNLKETTSTNKKYILEMLPYPSGKLHMGHVRNYTIGDVVARYYSMRGFEVIHPMGWDSFGLPAENAAIQSKVHPKEWTESNIQHMKNELQTLGCMYDWNLELSTCSEKYYKEEQKIFIDMHRRGLIYRKKSYVNWDPVEQTVLANEQVIDGRGWRSDALVERKQLEQWSVKITEYAEELLEGLKDLEGLWPENVLKMQENWIGKSEGALVKFDDITVYTTRPDTLFGASFVAISPDHPLSQKLAETDNSIRKFVDECSRNTLTTADIEKAEKNGKFTGIYVNHPVIEGEKLPVYIANFVLIEYGTGAVFGCPAHDERDFEFARKYDLPIKRVIESSEDLPYMGDGRHIDSEFLNGMNVEDAKRAMIEHLERKGVGEGQVTYKLRDWLVSRQRYWGCPIPFVHCKICGIVPVKEEDLPVKLPEDVVFDSSGNPLEKHPTWKHTKCPVCGLEAVRDTDTLDTFFESSWYFLRYLDPNCETPINKEISDKNMPVDLYIGGVEHAVLHLLYARFFTLALRDMGYVSITHPFKKLLTQGMVCHKSYKNEDGEWLYPEEVTRSPDGLLTDLSGNKVTEGPSEKMSKSKKNLVNPSKIIDNYGVDAVRLFIVSDTPPEKDLDWNTDALEGSWRFLKRVWNVFEKITPIISENYQGADDLVKITHFYMKKITYCLENIMLNKAVAHIRELFNEIEDRIPTSSSQSLGFAFVSFIKAIEPITPFISFEILEILGEKDNNWPEIDEELASVDNVTIAIQVNGKLRGTFDVPKDTDEKTLEDMAIEKLDITERVKKVIVVKNKIVNVVV